MQLRTNPPRRAEPSFMKTHRANRRAFARECGYDTDEMVRRIHQDIKDAKREGRW